MIRLFRIFPFWVRMVTRGVFWGVDVISFLPNALFAALSLLPSSTWTAVTFLASQEKRRRCGKGAWGTRPGWGRDQPAATCPAEVTSARSGWTVRSWLGEGGGRTAFSSQDRARAKAPRWEGP